MSLQERVKNNLCPICKKRQTYRKERVINNGYAIQNTDGSYYFKKTGKRTVVDKWWSCKKCTKTMSAKKYNDFLINLNNPTY